MPALPAPVLAERRRSRKIVLQPPDPPGRGRRRRPDLRAVDVHHPDRATSTPRCSRSPSSPRPAARSCASPCPSQDDADALAADREEVADPGDRRHPLPAQVRLRRDRRRLRGRARQPGQHQAVRRQGRRDRPRRQGRRRPHPHRRQRRLARQAAAGEVRQGDARGARRVGALGVLAVRGARLPRHQDLGEAQRPRRHGVGLPAARGSAATTRCTSASPRPARRSRARSSRRSRSARCSPRASATRSASRSRPRRSRRSRSATRSWSRSTCASAASRSCPARPAAAPRSTSTPSPSR